MSVVTKALDLLQHFSVTRPEIGLSQFRRLASHDKATTYRYLQSLEDSGFVEKNPETKAYRLGPMVLHLAQMRELTVPRQESARLPLEALAEATGETAHISILSGTKLHALSSCESNRHSARAVIDTQILPLHATGSGLCALAFGDAALMDAARENHSHFTEYSLNSIDDLSEAVETARQSGFGIANRFFEDDIYGIATPIFDQTGQIAGTVAVACIAARITPELEQDIKHQLVLASRDITRNWGGSIPPELETAWARTVSQPEHQDITT